MTGVTKAKTGKQYPESVTVCEDCQPRHKGTTACDGTAYVVGRTVRNEGEGKTLRFHRALHCRVCCPDRESWPEAAPDSDPMAVLASEQRVDLLTEFHFALEAFSVGLNNYLERQWKWNPDDMADPDPDAWKRVARISLYLARLDALKHALTYQNSTRPRAPFWCIGCRGEYPGAPYLRVECLAHDATPAAAYEWAQMFGAP